MSHHPPRRAPTAWTPDRAITGLSARHRAPHRHDGAIAPAACGWVAR